MPEQTNSQSVKQLNELTDEQIDRMVAERLEPNPKLPDGIIGPSVGGAWYFTDYWRPKRNPKQFTRSWLACGMLIHDLKTTYPYCFIGWHGNRFECEFSGVVDIGLAWEFDSTTECRDIAIAWLKAKERQEAAGWKK